MIDFRKLLDRFALALALMGMFLTITIALWASAGSKL